MAVIDQSVSVCLVWLSKEGICLYGTIKQDVGSNIETNTFVCFACFFCSFGLDIMVFCEYVFPVQGQFVYFVFFLLFVYFFLSVLSCN